MTVWQKLENEDCYAVALYNFNSSAALHLPLEVGELLHVTRETEDWYWGCSLRRDRSGAVPKKYVVIRDCVVDRCGETVVASAGGVGVVHDIAVTLREWLQHWKVLYTTNDERFKFMEVSMRALLELRAQAASGALPADQLRRVARTAVFTIDKGNRTLDMELAVRTISGELVDPLSISTFKLNALHDEANSRIDKNMETTPTSRPSSQIGSARSYTIVVHINNFVCRLRDAAELALALHDAAGNKLTESVLLRWPPAHLAAQELFTAPYIVFTDLGSDIKKERLFLVCHVVRIGSMEPQNLDHRRSSACPSGGMRRPCGVACADVTQHVAHDHSDKEIQLPFYACEKENMDSLLKKVMANLKDQKHSQGLWVFLQMVEGDLQQIRREKPHMVVGNTVFARKMGFPEVILPGDARNDLYVTLSGGSFSKGGKSSERNIELVARVVDKNGRTLPGAISVGAGSPPVDEFTSVVYYHEDRPRWQEVFKVCLNIEEFKETHIVFLCRHRSSNDAKDRAERHFALSFLRLMQKEGTTISDTTHNLAVYKIEHKRATASSDVEAEASSVCLELPSRRDELPAGCDRGFTRGPLTLLHRDSLTVATKLCSTKLTQREEILGVLKWSNHNTDGSLRTALTMLLRVPNDELVKFLQDILDALFSILSQVDEDETAYTEDSYSVLVLDCLLQVISLVADHKYQHFLPVLQVYIDTSFCDTLAYEKLISIMVWAIRSAERGEGASKRLLQCMKCLESLARVLVRSRQLRAALDRHPPAAPPAPPSAAPPSAAHPASPQRPAAPLPAPPAAPQPPPHHAAQLQSLLEALVGLMRCGDSALTCQGSALKYLPHAVPHLIKIYDDTQLCEYLVGALEALPLSRLSNQRLHALLELVRGPLAAAPAPRRRLLPHLAGTLRALLRTPAELDTPHKLRSADKAARLLGADTARLLDRTQQTQVVELCVETLGEVVTLLARDDVGSVEADRGELAKSLLPTVLRIAVTMMKDRNKEEGAPNDDPLLRKLICVLLDMVRQMSEAQYAAVSRAGGAAGARALAADALALADALLLRPAFRAHWADMLHVQYSVLLHLMRLLATSLRAELEAGEGAEAEAARAALRQWFPALAALACAGPLQLEALPAGRRRRAARLHGDVRRPAARLMSDMWLGLGEHKRHFIPSLVKPFLEVSFLRDEEVRNVIIPLFYDMMETEFDRTLETEGEGNLQSLEGEVIDKLDVLAEAGRGDAAWRARFVSLCGAACGDGRLRAAGGALVAAAARQLDALLQYRAAPPARRVHLVAGVLRFYEQIRRPHMYIRYVHRLAAMHRAAQHWTEAGLTLQLHAKLLDWADEPLPPRLRHPTQDQHRTHLDLKIALYEEVAALLEAGLQWELAVREVQQLVALFEARAQGYAALSALHAQLAALYRAPLQRQRLRPAYFRVRYLGRGFPDHLAHPQGFVHRGEECDMLHSFKERMQDDWPDAEVLLKLDEPGEDVTLSDGQYLQINAVTPVMAEKWQKLLSKAVDHQIVNYYDHNNVNTFVYSRPFHKNDDCIIDPLEDRSGAAEFATRWLERTELRTAHDLPGILRWFPIVSTRTFLVRPLEVAVETMTQTNKELKGVIHASIAPSSPLHPLTMRLQGILDSAVQGGLAQYEKAFLCPAYLEKRPEHAELLGNLRELIAQQMPLLKHGLEVHASRDPPRDLHARLVNCFREKYGRQYFACPEAEAETPEVVLRPGARDADERNERTERHERTAHRASDASAGNETTSKSKFSFNSAISWTRNSSTATLTPRHGKRVKSRKSELSLQSSTSQWYAPTNGNVSAINSAINSAFNTAFAGAAHGNLNNSLNNNLNHSSNSVNNNNVNGNNGETAPLRELRQELVCERPPRDERRLSHRSSYLALSDNNSTSPSNRDSLGTTDSNQEDEEPPPLPLKQSRGGEEEAAPPAPRHSYDLVLAPRASFLHSGGAAPPTPPPKKRHQHA